jgi:hypothetical protein
MNVRWRGVALALGLCALLVLGLVTPRPSSAHFIYTCPGYSYNSLTGEYTLPDGNNCNRDPYTNWGVHQWAAEQAKLILFYDGYVRYATLLQSTINIGGTGEGRRHISLLIDGVIAADTLLNGCTSYGASVGWPLGDHMLNPYRHFGVWSYYLYPARPGWYGRSYPGRDHYCPGAPRVRTNSARMADEFFARAQREWRAFHPGDAMFNLGIALHAVQDATVPSHVHPESQSKDTFLLKGLPIDAYPAWAAEKRASHAVSSGGWYGMPSSRNGVTVSPTAGGWVYWMAAEAYPYFYWDPTRTAVLQSMMGCNVTRSPEGCPAKADWLLKMTQRASAGFLRFFFGSVGYAPG